MAATRYFQSQHPTTGAVGTRSSQSKVYTHCVWARELAAHKYKMAGTYRDTAVRNIQYWEGQIEKHGPDATAQWQNHTHSEGLQRAKDSLAKWQGILDAGLEAMQPGEWGVLTWCSRYDLAQKQLGSKRDVYETVLAEVFEVDKKGARL